MSSANNRNNSKKRKNVHNNSMKTQAINTGPSNKRNTKRNKVKKDHSTLKKVILILTKDLF